MTDEARKKMRHLDLFSGIGGFSLACKWVWGDEYENVGHSEIEKFPCKVYHKHFPESECLGDITKIEWTEGQADLITGGFPCQPFSHAARGNNVAVDLFPEMLRCVSSIRPRFVLAENVQRKPVEIAARSFRIIGYGVRIICLSAHQFGAHHQRNRWWLIAYADRDFKFQDTLNAEASIVPSMEKSVWSWENYSNAVRVADGVSNRMDRLKALGNAIVPQVAEVILRAIKSQWG